MGSDDRFDLKKLVQKHGFEHFDLDLTPQQKKQLGDMAVKTSGSYDNFGDKSALPEDIQKFFEALGNNKAAAQEQSLIVSSLIENTIDKFGAETAWVTIRAAQPTTAYDTPRWHIDGYYYTPYSGDQLKAVIPLKGEGTLLQEMSTQDRTEFINLLRSSFDEPNQREKCAKFVAEHSLGEEKTPEGFGTTFIVGAKDHAAIHSEPPIHSERLFLSVLPGSHEQIENLRTVWKKNATEINISPPIDKTAQNNLQKWRERHNQTPTQTSDRQNGPKI